MQLPARLDPRAVAAARAFLTPSRVAPRPAERILLDAARPRVIRTPAGPVRAYAWGDGAATVLLVHGWSSHAGHLGAFVAPLLGRDLRVVALDAPGHGASPGDLAHVPAFADAVEAVVAAIGPVSAAVAHSGGATGCARAAARGAPLGRMAWLAPMPSLRAFAAREAEAAGLDAAERAAFLDELEAIAGASLDALELDAMARSLDGPIRIVHDRDDALVPIADVRRAAARIPAATLRETSGLGHGRVLVDRDVVREVVDFVAARS